MPLNPKQIVADAIRLGLLALPKPAEPVVKLRPQPVKKPAIYSSTERRAYLPPLISSLPSLRQDSSINQRNAV